MHLSNLALVGWAALSVHRQVVNYCLGGLKEGPLRILQSLWTIHVRIGHYESTVTHLLSLLFDRLIENVMHLVRQVVVPIRVHDLWYIFDYDVL